jgi:hypothetical protein
VYVIAGLVVASTVVHAKRRVEQLMEDARGPASAADDSDNL